MRKESLFRISGLIDWLIFCGSAISVGGIVGTFASALLLDVYGPIHEVFMNEAMFVFLISALGAGERYFINKY